MLDAAAYPLLWQLALATWTPPEFYVAVMLSESGLDPSRPNASGAPYYGINQVSGDYLRAHGINPSDYLTWPASKQLARVVVPMFKENVRYLGHAPKSPGVLYGLNFLPGRVKERGDSPDTVLADRNDGRWYSQNTSLDTDNNGKITISDLDEILARLATKSQAYADAYEKLYLMVPPGWRDPRTKNVSLMWPIVGGFLTGLVALLVALRWKR
jgi:hypothetical protein